MPSLVGSEMCIRDRKIYVQVYVQQFLAAIGEKLCGFISQPSINNHIVGLVHKNRIIRTCLMYHAAYKVEFQRFKRSYSQLTFLNFFIKYHKSHWCVRGFVARNVRLYIVTCPLRREILLIKSVGWSFSSQNWEH